MARNDKNARPTAIDSPGRRGRRLRRAGIVLLVMGLAGAGFLHWRDIDPELVVPSYPMPSPNAYDDFVQATRLLPPHMKVDDAYYSGLHASARPDHSYSAAEKASILRECRGVLRLVHQGLIHSYRQPPNRSLFTRSGDTAGFRSLARLLGLESRVRAGQGNWSGAMESALDCVQFGVEMAYGGGLLACLTGDAVQDYGQVEIAFDLPHLDARQARAAARRLQGIMAGRNPYSETLREAERSDLAWLMELMRQPGWRWTMAQEMVVPEQMASWIMSRMPGMDDSGSGGLARDYPAILWTANYLSLAPYSKRQITGHYVAGMETAIADALLPYPMHRADASNQEDPVSGYLMSAFASGRFRHTKTMARDALLTGALLIRAYQLEHSHTPERLSETAPRSYLPEDPFAMSGSVRYRRAGAGYVLYSVGPDGRDDGGRPCVTPKLRNNPYLVEEESKGDMVLGVSR